MNTILDQRRLRLRAATSGLSRQLWAVILIGTGITIGLTWFFGVESSRAHVAMTVCLAVAVALVIYLIASMDHPFRGDLSVGPDVFEQVLDSITHLAADEKAAAR